MWVSGTQDGSSILPGDTRFSGYNRDTEELHGLVAQLVERCIRIAEVAGSSPVESTRDMAAVGMQDPYFNG